MLKCLVYPECFVSLTGMIEENVFDRRVGELYHCILGLSWEEKSFGINFVFLVVFRNLFDAVF